MRDGLRALVMAVRAQEDGELPVLLAARMLCLCLRSVARSMRYLQYKRVESFTKKAARHNDGTKRKVDPGRGFSFWSRLPPNAGGPCENQGGSLLACSRVPRSTFEAAEADCGLDSSPETHYCTRRLTADTARAVATAASAVRERKVFPHQTFRLGTPSRRPVYVKVPALCGAAR